MLKRWSGEAVMASSLLASRGGKGEMRRWLLLLHRREVVLSAFFSGGCDAAPSLLVAVVACPKKGSWCLHLTGGAGLFQGASL
jgi:hypothetical protein